VHRIKFLTSNETVSNPFQEKAHKRHNLLHTIGSEDHLEFYGPSKQICQPSPLPRRHGHNQRDIRRERDREREVFNYTNIDLCFRTQETTIDNFTIKNQL